LRFFVITAQAVIQCLLIQAIDWLFNEDRHNIFEGNARRVFNLDV